MPVSFSVHSKAGLARFTKLIKKSLALHRVEQAGTDYKALRLCTEGHERIEPMRGSAVRLAVYSATYGALPLMAHPRRYALP